MRLICGIDTTRPDPAPAEFAAKLSDELGADLVLAHIVPPAAAFPSGSGTGAQAMHGAVTQAMNEQLRDSNSLSRNDAGGIVESGDPAARLVALADEEPDSMIVVGSRRRSAATAALLGSVSREVVLRARCPVLVVPSRDEGGEGAPEGPLETIVVGYDGGEESRVALTCSAAIAAGLGARLVLAQAPIPVADYPPGAGAAALHLARAASHEPPRGLEAIERLPWDIPVSLVRVAGGAQDAIATVADRARAGMVAVGSRGRGPLGELLFGSTSSALARKVGLPVMICTRRAASPPS